jgi:hypothetical protein
MLVSKEREGGQTDICIYRPVLLAHPPPPKVTYSLFKRMKEKIKILQFLKFSNAQETTVINDGFL